MGVATRRETCPSAAAHGDELRRHSEAVAAQYRQRFLAAINERERADDFDPTTVVESVVDLRMVTLDGGMVHDGLVGSRLSTFLTSWMSKSMPQERHR